jgi:hypothetical protein
MNTNMTTPDRRLSALPIAPVAVLIGVLIGPESVASIVLYALAAMTLVTSAAAYCPLHSLFGTGGRHRQPQAH